MTSGSRPVSPDAQRMVLAMAWHLVSKRLRVHRREPLEEKSASETLVESFLQSKKFSRFQNIAASESLCGGDVASRLPSGKMLSSRSGTARPQRYWPESKKTMAKRPGSTILFKSNI